MIRIKTSRSLKSALILTAAATLTAACNPVDGRQESLLREGAWGWSNGQGCADLADAWVVEGDLIEMFQGGRLVDRGRLERRDLLYDNMRTSGDGALEYVAWTYIGRTSLDTQALGRIRTVFAIRGGPGRARALVARNHRRYNDAQSGETERIENPRGGDRLVHCDDVAG